MRVLVVDDEPGVLRVISRMLADEGHTVVTAGGALEAVALLSEQDFELALIDYELHTALTGVDVGKHAKRGTALVMITGHSPEEMAPKIEYPLRGFLAVIGKPPSKEEILAIVERVSQLNESTRP